MPRKGYVPTEDQDCMTLVQWMELKGLRFSHIPQETFTRNWGIKIKNKKKGVRKGVPDYIIVHAQKILFIEMKRSALKNQPSSVKQEQQEWIAELNTVPSVTAVVCFGFDEAIATITRVLNV